MTRKSLPSALLALVLVLSVFVLVACGGSQGTTPGTQGITTGGGRPN